MFSQDLQNINFETKNALNKKKFGNDKKTGLIQLLPTQFPLQFLWLEIGLAFLR